MIHFCIVFPMQKNHIILSSVVPSRVKKMVQSTVQVGKEYTVLLEREGEGEESVWSAIDLAGIHPLC